MSDKESLFVSFEVATAEKEEAFAFTPEAFATAAGVLNGPGALLLSQDMVKPLSDLADLLVSARYEHLETLVGGFFDGVALGLTEGMSPDAKDLPGLAGELAETLGKDSEAEAAFELGLGLGRSLEASGAMDALGLTDGLPDPTVKPDGEGEGSATELFTQVREGLQGSLGRALDLDAPMDSGRGLSGTEAAERREPAGAPGSNGWQWHGTGRRPGLDQGSGRLFPRGRGLLALRGSKTEPGAGPRLSHSALCDQIRRNWKSVLVSWLLVE